MLNILKNSPFRILGVYSNAKPAEIVSNCDDMEAYLSVGQKVSFDLDLNNLMPDVVRSADSVINAKKQINLPKDKLKHALFWFVKGSSSAHALCHLKNGDLDNANSVFEIEDTFSTLINKAVVAMIRDDLETAISYTTEMIHDDEIRTAFVSAICGSTFLISEDEMAHLYIDTLLEENNASDLMNLFQDNGTSEDDDEYLREKAIGEPVLRINAEIAKAKAVKRDDADANYRAGKVLMNNTKNDLAKVKSMLGMSDMKYQMLADDLANAILQCGINYYNNSEDDDDIENAMVLQEYACKIAVGKICKDRCNQNLAILEKKKKEMPPTVVKEHDVAIKACILNRIIIGGQTIDNAIAMMKECAPHIVAIKEYPDLREYYLNISTQVVNAALSSVIEDHNNTLERFGSLSTTSALSAVKEMLKKAWKATLMMDKFDKEESFKNGRYSGNRKSLYEIVESSGVYVTRGIFGYSSNNIPSQIGNDELDLRTEEEVWNECRTSTDFKSYMNRYPNAKHKTAAKRKYDELFAKEEAIRKEREERERKARLEKEADDKAFRGCASISDYEAYLQRYPNGRHKSEAERLIREKKETISTAIKWIAIVLGIIVWAASGGFGWGLLVGGIGFVIGVAYNN